MNDNNVIVNFTPTGMLPSKLITSFVPISVNEIVEDVHKAAEAGITMVHLHARDQITGMPTFKKEIYALLIEGIRKHLPDLVICVSLSGRNNNDFKTRSEVLDLDDSLKPDMASLTLSSLNFNQQASINEPEMIISLAQKMKDRGILPELEVFDVGMINYAKYLEKKGLITSPHYFNLIIGNIACAQANPLHVSVMINDLPINSLWSIGGIGNVQLSMNMLAVALGGGARLGLEDNIWFDNQRTKLASNIDLLNRIKKIIQLSERDVMKPSELRLRLGLNNGYGLYGKLSTKP